MDLHFKNRAESLKLYDKKKIKNQEKMIGYVEQRQKTMKHYVHPTEEQGLSKFSELVEKLGKRK